MKRSTLLFYFDYFIIIAVILLIIICNYFLNREEFDEQFHD